MAFIRWKKNRAGIRKAYLIHSYRGRDGSPKHKTLAYLGSTGELTPQLAEELKTAYPDIVIDWANIKPAGQPKITAVTDVSKLSDTELMRNLRKLRQERGLTIVEMLSALQNAGFTALIQCGFVCPVSRGYFGRLEHIFGRQEWSDSMNSIMNQIVQYIRKVFSSPPGAN